MTTTKITYQIEEKDTNSNYWILGNKHKQNNVSEEDLKKRVAHLNTLFSEYEYRLIKITCTETIEVLDAS